MVIRGVTIPASPDRILIWNADEIGGVMLSPLHIEMCERPVKQMVQEHFLRFGTSQLVSYLRVHQVKLDRVPMSYRTLGDTLATIRKLPECAVAPVWVIPDRVRPMMVENRETQDIWGLQLIYTHELPEWREGDFEPLGAQKSEAKKQLGMLLAIATGYLQALAMGVPELHSHSLTLDKDRMSLHLHDTVLASRPLGYIHVRLWKMTGEEIDAQMT
jgi:hypothetical protein